MVAYDIVRDICGHSPYLDSNKTTMVRIPTNAHRVRSWNIDISLNKELAKWFTTNTVAAIYQNSFSGSANGFSLDDAGFPTVDLVSIIVSVGATGYHRKLVLNMN